MSQAPATTAVTAPAGPAGRGSSVRRAPSWGTQGDASARSRDDRPVVMLQEHRSQDDVELTDAAARDLAALAGRRLTVGVGPRAGTWQLTASQHVGTLVTPDVAVLVRPKVPLQNLFVLLDVALPSIAWGDLSFAYGSDDHLLAAFAELFARKVDHTLGQGVLRAYREHREREMALRGRIDIATIVSRGGVAVPIPCRYDELTADVPENRYLKAATRRLLRVPGLPVATRRRLRRNVALLDEVANVEPRVDELDGRPFTRLTRYYEGALRLARLVLANLTVIDRAGANDAASFMLDMNVLFQNWVTEQLERRLRPHRVDVEAEPTLYLGERNRVAMHPDLLFRRDGETVLVGDVKYKLADSGTGRAPDYYQLLAYATVTGLSTGLLVYSQSADADTGPAPAQELVVSRGGQRLLVHRIDLSGDRASIDAAADHLAARILALTRPPVPTRAA